MTDPTLASLPREQWLTAFQEMTVGTLPGLLGIRVVEIEPGRSLLRLELRPELLLRSGYVHGGTIAALADTAAGYGCAASLPEHAGGFTTLELKTNLLGAALDGDELEAEGRIVHGGRTTQVWDVTVTRPADRRTVGLFRCTQLLLEARRENGATG